MSGVQTSHNSSPITLKSNHVMTPWHQLFQCINSSHSSSSDGNIRLLRCIRL